MVEHVREAAVVNQQVSFRDPGPYSARNTQKGALIQETAAILHLYHDGASVEGVRGAVLGGKLFKNKAFETRRSIWNAVYRRVLEAGPEWSRRELAEMAARSPSGAEFSSMLYVHHALRDRLTFDFVVGALWERWERKSVRVDRAHVQEFLRACADRQPGIQTWRESTRQKLASNMLSALRDFGLMKGTQKKTLQKPSLCPTTALHLARLLHEEGLRGRSLLQAPDWRLFFTTEDELSTVLLKLSQEKKIQFERGGRTVILEIPEASSA